MPESMPAALWRSTSGGSDWVAIDLETTGLHWRTDRIVEIGIVRYNERGQELDAWTTLLDPLRDMGATHIHGITARDVFGAPTFRDAAPDVLSKIANARLVAHNARFDLGFLGAELMLAGVDWGQPDAFCTMSVPYEYGLVDNRRLGGCCAELGIPFEGRHSALDDARACGGILFATIERLRPEQPAFPAVAPEWPAPHEWISPRLRGQPAPLTEGRLGALADRVGVPDGLPISDAVALAYLDLLDRVLEDRRLSTEEVEALASASQDWGISAQTAGDLHRAYLAGIGELALADGVITAAERADLARLTELLGVGPTRPGEVLTVRPAAREESLVGRSVCFTGESVCTMDGDPLSRDDQERLAATAGLIVKGNVSGRLDLLVLADSDSRSGKARKADDLGVRKMAEPVFWRAIGVEID
jgi:DNA polymerase III, epsilon subunit and related 3''-5'' exonucleases